MKNARVASTAPATFVSPRGRSRIATAPLCPAPSRSGAVMREESVFGQPARQRDHYGIAMTRTVAVLGDHGKGSLRWRVPPVP